MNSEQQLQFLDEIVAKAKRAGASAAEAMGTQQQSLKVECREGSIEGTTRSESTRLSVRVFVGNRQATMSTSAIGSDEIENLIEKAIACARISPEDPYAGLLPVDHLLGECDVDLQCVDSDSLTIDDLSELALTADDAAINVSGVERSAGSSAFETRHSFALVTSDGFVGNADQSMFGISCAAIAKNKDAMESDSDFTQACFRVDLAEPIAVGVVAGERAVARLGGESLRSGAMPIIYAPRVANTLLGHFAAAISGPAVAMKTSFLRDCMGEHIFAKGVTVIDDPRRTRGMGSRLFDGEGAATKMSVLVDDGVLKSWILDSASARQLGLSSTGHAQRTNVQPTPGPFNLFMQAGEVSPTELMSDIKLGFYVTSLIGQGVNTVTGDYSRGASGFLIRDGQIATPVKETTIAGNLTGMFKNLKPANDLKLKYRTDAPTVRVDGMTVAGA